MVRAGGINLLLVFSFSLLLGSVIVHPVHAGTETLITVNATGTSEVPAISGNWIVWEDNRDSTQFKIYAYNVVTGEERVIRGDAAGEARNPRISGNTVVWQDARNGNWDIYAYDFVSGTETRITYDVSDQRAPDVSGSRIVWQDNRSGTSFDIYQNDTSTWTESLLSPGTQLSNQKFPAISGNLVVWQDYRNGAKADIFMNDTTTNTLYNLTPATLLYDQILPSISDSRVVWVNNTIATGKIGMNDTSTWVTSIVDNAPAAKFLNRPAIDGTKIVWLDSRNRTGPKYDVYLRDLSGSGQVNITTPSAQVVIVNDVNINMMGPAISGNRIVWTDIRNNVNRNIYMYTIGPTETCPVAAITMPAQTGAIPYTVHYLDASSSGTVPADHWKWEFGDGNTSTQQNPVFTYNVPGNFNVRLTINNALCRNETPVSNAYRVNVGAAPVASFTTNTTSGIVTLPVKFNDTSLAATMWNWSFGDPGNSWFNTTDPLQKNVTFLYTTSGTYTATLNASNTYGYSTATKTINALNGANANADTTITGIVIDNRFGGQFLVFDGSTLAGYANPAPGTLISPPLPGHGWQNITFLSGDATGFHDFGNGTLMGNLTSVILQTKEINLAGFSKSTGAQSSINYSITLPSYPVGGTVNTQVWEGVLPSDLSTFGYIASHSNFNAVTAVAYTTKITKTGFPVAGSARLHMSVNSSSWIAQLPGGNTHTYIERIADDGSTGEVLQARYLYTDTTKDLDYFEADSPHGTSTFGLALLSGSGNPLQLITLTVASHIAPAGNPAPENNPGTNPGSSAGHGSGSGNAQTSANAPKAPEIKAPPVDPGKTEKIYANAQGVITQATLLKSTDNLASVSLVPGVVATDSAGKPLASISLASIPPENVPGAPAGTVSPVNGLAYEITPSGATFSPAITVSFTIPQAQWGREYSVKTFDHATGTWQDLPSSFNPSTGTLTAEVTHLCCFAVFSKPFEDTSKANVPVTLKGPVSPSRSPEAPPPTTAISILGSLLVWATGLVIQNGYLISGLVALGSGLFVIIRWGLPGS